MKSHRKQLSKRFSELPLLQKVQFIWDYYKLPIFLVVIIICVAGSFIIHNLNKKDTILNIAFVNVAVSDDTHDKLIDNYLSSDSRDKADSMIKTYDNLLVTENVDATDEQYAYASKMKILGAIDSEALDIVFMDKESYDSFSQNGYLCDLDSLLSANCEPLFRLIKSDLESNTVILEDNSVDVLLNNDEKYQSSTKTVVNGINLSHCPYIKNAGFSDNVYLGIIDNSPRKDEIITYLQYLYNNVK